MKINRIKITNILGARHVDITPRTPVILFAGFNGAAKSSIQEAVRMAFTGVTLRVSLKRDYPTMVSEGAKSGTCSVSTDSGTASYTLPSGVHTLEGDLLLGLPDALPFVLNAQGFASLTPEARRTFLFSLTHCSVTEAIVQRILIEKECDPAKVAQTVPLLKSITGFPAAATFASTKATEAKGAWKALTGENYGSKKSEEWEADKPEYDPQAITAATTQRDAADDALRLEQTALGTLTAQQAQYNLDIRFREKAEATAGQIGRIRNKLAIDEKNLSDLELKVADLATKAGAAPRVGLVHEFGAAAETMIDTLSDDQRPSTQQAVAVTRSAFDKYVEQFGLPSNVGDPDVLSELVKYRAALTLMQNAVTNGKRDLASSEAAATLIAGDAPKRVSDEDVHQAQLRITACKTAFTGAANSLAALLVIADQAAQADEKTANAATHHSEVTQWLAIADQLAPNGIPAQLLAQALRPVNTAMRQSAVATGWRQPTINTDMTITAEGRDYALHSESERWRIDAMIADAIAELSEVRVLLLDRVDVLDNDGRVELMLWLAGRAEAGAINTALLFATLKQPPTGLPAAIACEWIHEGSVLDLDALIQQFPALEKKLLDTPAYRKAA
jgi:hypothetical protein